MNKGRSKNENLAVRPMMVRFTKKQHKELKVVSEKSDVSIASLVRLAVSKYLGGG